MPQWLLLIAAILGGSAVMLGAFAAHALKARLSDAMLHTFQTGVTYQMYHALALLAVALLWRQVGASVWLQWSGGLLVAGCLLFSGSLYALAFGGPKWLGPITPLGGLCFIVAWACLAVAACQLSSNV